MGWKPTANHPWKKDLKPPPAVEQPRCSFCSEGKLFAQTPNNGELHFRCEKCNVRVVVTNPSYIPKALLTYYRYLVNSQQLSTQTWQPDDNLSKEK